MQFMNSSLDKLVKNLSDEDFKYLVEKFGSKNLVLLKQEGAYHSEYMNSSERSKEKNLPARKYFFSSKKKEKLVMMVKNQTVALVLKIIWRVKKFGISFTWKIWVIIMIIIWKKMYCY